MIIIEIVLQTMIYYKILNYRIGDDMLKEYKTIWQEAEDEISEKKSRFIASVRPVKTEEEAKAFIDEIRKKHYNATHNVFAYQVGENNDIQRYSDDGEPQGTAGMPVLNVLTGEDVKNAAIVVTRYFGGTLLGTGGLVRAYGKAAKNGLLKAGIIEMILYCKYTITTNYTDSGKIQYELLEKKHKILDTIYTELVTYVVLIKEENEQEFLKSMIEITRGQGKIEEMGKVYGADINGNLEIFD